MFGRRHHTCEQWDCVYSDNQILWCSFARPYFPLFDTITTTSCPDAVARPRWRIIVTLCVHWNVAKWCVHFLMKYRQNNVFILFLLPVSVCVKIRWHNGIRTVKISRMMRWWYRRYCSVGTGSTERAHRTRVPHTHSVDKIREYLLTLKWLRMVLSFSNTSQELRICHQHDTYAATQTHTMSPSLAGSIVIQCPWHVDGAQRKCHATASQSHCWIQKYLFYSLFASQSANRKYQLPTPPSAETRA